MSSAIPPRRYDADQLAHLMEISAVVQCECPNQLSRVLASLTAFEDYSKNCESTSAKDAEIHAMLYRRSAEARVVLEKALAELCAYEEIEV